MIEMVQNDISEDGMRRVRMVSDQVIDPASIEFTPPLPKGAGVSSRAWSDDVLHLHYAEWTWACMGFVDFHFEAMPKFRRLFVWKFLPGERVSEVIRFVSDWYFMQTHHRPQYAWMKKLPKGIEWGTEVEGCSILEADWALPGCVLIGG